MTIEVIGRGLEVAEENPLVVKNHKDITHFHSYGGLTPFFHGLVQGKLMATRCPQCRDAELWLPPRTHCPDCIEPMRWEPAPLEGKVYTHSTVQYPGAGFKLTSPCPLISVELPGVCTKLMSYLQEGTPSIGMPIRAVFRTENPTHTILDLAWVPL